MNKEEYFKNNPEEFRLKCSICGKEFIPESYKQYHNLTLKAKKYNRDFFCSDECRNKKIKTNVHELKCANCGKEFYSKKGCHKEDIDKPHFCSHTCSAFYHNKTSESNSYRRENICIKCGKKFISKRCSKFCCKQCEIEYKNSITEQKILNDEIIYHKTLRNYLIKIHNKCCNPECKWDWSSDIKPILELHHKDGNHKNTRLSNCELLCPNCHSITDNYKFKGGHKSTRDYRKKYYKKKV